MQFWRSVAVGEPYSCWEWQCARQLNGYGHLSFHGETTSAHRVAYELAHGPIPDGLIICHRCDNPPCCNPAHLFIGTHKDNTQDAVTKGRMGVAIARRGPDHPLYGRQPSARTADGGLCRRGHPLEGDNVLRISGGRRRCRICHQSYKQAYNQAYNQVLATLKAAGGES